MNNTLIQYFHWYAEGDSKLWDRVIDQASYLSDLGITAAWLPPAYKGASGEHSTGYDPYDLYDLGEFDQKGSVPTKYGTRDQFLKACQTLKDNNVQVIVDIVLNHKAGGDELETFTVVEVDTEQRDKGISEPFEIESYTRYNFEGRGDKYSNFKWNFTCFTGVDYAEGHEGNHIFRIINDYGDDWDDMISDEKGNYDFLMSNDIETRNPCVSEELDNWGKWFHDQCGFDGVRLDAVKHMSPQFYKDWLLKLRSNTGQNLFAVGEYWAPGDLDLLEKYLGATEGAMMLFDSALHENLANASEAGESYDMRQIFDNSLMMSNPMFAVTLVTNHDTQPLQELEAPVSAWFKPLAYALILLRAEGYPCVFYADLYGASYKDTGNDGGEYDITIGKVESLENLIRARAQYAYGEQYVYFDDESCVGFTRLGDDDHSGCAVIMSNSGAASKSMEMGGNYAGKNFVDMLGHCDQTITIDEHGWCEFPVEAGSVSVWIAQE